MNNVVNRVPLGNGKNRKLYAPYLPSNLTFTEFLEMIKAGNLYVDLNANNATTGDDAGIATEGTAINKALFDSIKSDLDLKAPLESPTLTGNPIVPNQVITDNSSKIANTKFVQDLIASKVIADISTTSAVLTLTDLNLQKYKAYKMYVEAEAHEDYNDTLTLTLNNINASNSYTGIEQTTTGTGVSYASISNQNASLITTIYKGTIGMGEYVIYVTDEGTKVMGMSSYSAAVQVARDTLKNAFWDVNITTNINTMQFTTGHATKMVVKIVEI